MDFKAAQQGQFAEATSSREGTDPEMAMYTGPSLKSDTPRRKMYCYGKCTKPVFIGGICCGVCCAILLIAVLVGLFAIAPMFAQNAVNASVIVVTGMSITSSTANSMSMVMEFDAWNTYPLAATLKESSINVEYSGQAIGSMVMPELKLAPHGKTQFSRNVVLSVAPDQLNAFAKYASDLMTKESIVMAMVGEVDVHAGGMTFGVDLDSKVPVTGFNNFNAQDLSTMTDNPPVDVRRPEFVSMKFVEDETVPAGTVVAIGRSILPNPSVVTVADSGYLQADVFVRGKKVAVAQSLEPISVGPNGADVSIRMTISKTDDNEEALREMFSNYVNGDYTEVTVQGTGSSASLWAEPLKAMRVSFQVPGLAENERIFVAVQQPLNFTSATLMNTYPDEDRPRYNEEYCKRIFSEDPDSHCDGIYNGGMMPMTTVIRNSLDMGITVTDFLFKAIIASDTPDFCFTNGEVNQEQCPSYLDFPGLDMSFKGKEFGRAGPYKGEAGYTPFIPQPSFDSADGSPWIEMADQESIYLAPKSTRPQMMSLVAAVSPTGGTVAGLIANYLYPTMMKLHGYPSNIGLTFYGMDGVPFFVDLVGTGTMTTASGFSLSGVNIVQRNVPVFMNFVKQGEGRDPQIYGPFVAGAPKSSPWTW